MKIHIQHSYNQHWSSSELCSLPTTLLPVHQRLHIQRPLRQAPEVCRRHHTDRPHSGRDESAYRQEVKELAVWCSLNNLELNMLKTVEMTVNFRRTPPPPTHHHEQHCDCSGVIQVPGHHHLPGPEVGQSHRLHYQKGPAEVVLPSPAEEVKPATGAADTVLLCHH